MGTSKLEGLAKGLESNPAMKAKYGDRLDLLRQRWLTASTLVEKETDAAARASLVEEMRAVEREASDLDREIAKDLGIPLRAAARPRSALAADVLLPSESQKFATLRLDGLSKDDFARYWGDAGTDAEMGAQEAMKSALRYPYGEHEWLKVSQVPKLKEWGVPMKTFREAQVPTESAFEVGLHGEHFEHGGLGSGRLHSEMDAIFEGASGFDDFAGQLNAWADRTFLNGRKVLPPVLRR